MDIDRVPRTTALGLTASSAKAAMLLDKILLPGRGFTHWEPIHHACRSGRVLFQRPHEGAVSFPRPFKGIDVMMAFERLGDKQRYDPVENPGFRKGWSVEKMIELIDRMPAAVVWCEWVE